MLRYLVRVHSSGLKNGSCNTLLMILSSCQPIESSYLLSVRYDNINPDTAG